MFVDFLENNEWVLMKKVRYVLDTDIYECVQFGADQNLYLDIVNLNVVS